MSEDKKNIRKLTLLKAGRSFKGSHRYFVVEDENTIGFKSDIKLFSGLAVGTVLQCETENGETFNKFAFYEGPDGDKFKHRYADKIEKWSVNTRLFLEERKLIAAGKKQHSRSIESHVEGLVRATNHLSRTQRVAIAFYVQSKLL